MKYSMLTKYSMLRKDRKAFIHNWVELKKATYTGDMEILCSFEKEYNERLDEMEDVTLEWIKQNKHFQKFKCEFRRNFTRRLKDTLIPYGFATDDEELEYYFDEHVNTYKNGE